MKTVEAVAHFGSQAALARALGIRQPSVATWGDDVPALRQLQIEKITGGKLRADPSILPESPPTPQQAAHQRARGQMS